MLRFHRGIRVNSSRLRLRTCVCLEAVYSNSSVSRLKLHPCVNALWGDLVVVCVFPIRSHHCVSVIVCAPGCV